MCVCVCEHLWLQSGVGLRVHVFGFSVQESVSERVVRHGISEVTPNQKNSDLAVVSVCVYLVFSIVNGCVVVSAFWQRVVCVCHGVWCVSLCGCKVALVGGVRLRVCRLGSAGCSRW